MILALQTADMTTRLWLINPSDATSAAIEPALTWDSGRQLSDGLLAKITSTLDRAGAALENLSGIIIFSGPGSFTSLRIGHSVANALADSLDIPVIGVVGQDWIQTGLHQLKVAKPGHPVLPHYGSEAHITKPKVD